jgi:hypothetical protein
MSGPLLPHEWATRLDPRLTNRHGVEELHNAWFEPPRPSDKSRPVVGLLIPECELQLCRLMKDGRPLTHINRPETNKNVKQWLRTACRIADEQTAWLSVLCDTPEQVEIAARRIANWLPEYQRVALERMYEPASRERTRLS